MVAPPPKTTLGVYNYIAFKSERKIIRTDNEPENDLDSTKDRRWREKEKK